MPGMVCHTYYTSSANATGRVEKDEPLPPLWLEL